MSAALTDQTFKNEIASGIVLVDFWAAWCGPCKLQGPIVEDVAKQFEGTASVKVAKLNVDENPMTAQQFGVMSIPTLIIFKNGTLAEQMIGLQTKQTLIDRIKKHTS